MKSPRILLLGLVLLWPSLRLAAADELADSFRQPPAAAKPQTWWHWMNGNITKEGITADLEAMQRIGLGGAQIFNVDQHEAAGPVKFLSPEWSALIKHAITEADRLGLDIAMHNCAGWSESGGPWVTPAQSMQKVVWTETTVSGGRHVSVTLAQPETVAGYYDDIAVLAFPTLTGDRVQAVAPTITTSAPAGATRDARLAVETPAPAPGKPQFVTFDFQTPQACASLRMEGVDNNVMPSVASIETSDDGTTWRKIADYPALGRGRNYPTTLLSFPETRTRLLRLTMLKADARAKRIALTKIAVGGPRLTNIEEKIGMKPNPDSAFSHDVWPQGSAMARAAVVDLTANFHEGKLDWDAPVGEWTMVRFGHTSTGQNNAPAPESGRGLECDKLNRAAVEAHFEAMIGKVIADVGPLAGKSFKYVLADSWEAGCANWTPAFRAEFQRRRGYDPLLLLPVLTGRAVESIDVSERFLWDYRRTVADLVVENHYAVFKEECAKHGMLFTAEAPGIGMPTIADELECKGRTDVPMGEFWFDGHNDSKETAASAHVYGLKIAAAEAFTARTEDAKWMKAPFDHKALGDLNFTRGINRFVFHRYAHQPWLDRVPGMTMGPWGTNFERTNTWWEQGRAWMEYITRCQYLLQEGRFVADVCYLYGEGAPETLYNREPSIPAGYDYDAINAEVLRTRLSVKDGRLTLPDGVSYRVLVLRDTDRMTPETLRKIRDLVAAGATVVGQRPKTSPSLAGYPSCDTEVRKLALEVWADCDGKGVTEHRLGRGRVIWGRPLATVLAEAGAPADFESGEAVGKIVTIHRRIGEAEVYFVSNQQAIPVQAKLTFRVTGRLPELWHPETGEIERPAEWSEHDGRVTVPVKFDPAGSVFVVFRAKSAGIDPVASIQRIGKEEAVRQEIDVNRTAEGKLMLTTAMSGRYTINTAAGKQWSAIVLGAPALPVLNGPWEVHFPPNWGAPEKLSLAQLDSWTHEADDGVKYFSGTAVYVKEFELAPEALGGGREVWLDLGRVKEVAEVRLNGRDLGVLWKPPFRMNLTGSAKAGPNRLEIRVTNLWPNRLIGDQRLPENQRRTWSTFNPFKADSPLLESGLMGPVRLESVVQVPLTLAAR